jgi:hypothetical protein
VDACHRPAGDCWDAVRAPAYLGQRALALLGNRQGAVIRDPWGHQLYWFLPAGAGASWEPIEIVDVFGTACWIEVPPAGRTSGLGPYWLREPAPGRLTTDPARLHAALRAVALAEFGPREVTP